MKPPLRLSPAWPILPMLFVPNGRILGALQSLIKGVYQGPFAGLQTFFAVSHDSASGRLALDGEAGFTLEEAVRMLSGKGG